MKYYVNMKNFYNENSKDIFVIWGEGDTRDYCQYLLWKNNIEISFLIDSDNNIEFIQNKGKLVFNTNILDQLSIERTYIFLAVDSLRTFEEYSKILKIKGFTEQDYSHFNQKYMNTINKMQSTTRVTTDYAEMFSLNNMPLFRLLEIELINRCNGKCEFCIVNTAQDTRPYARMSDELFYSIINQLKTLKYTGRISLHSNSEPLLDDRLIKFARYIHEELPHAMSITITNGTLLTLDIFKELIVYLDILCINNYSNDYEFHSSIKEIYEYCLNHPNIAKKVHIQKRLDNEMLHSRGGSSPNAEKCKVFGHVCSYPFSQMIIRPDGKLSFCCADALAKTTLGDLTKQSISDAWNSNEYVKIRKLALKGSEKLPLCSVCSNSGPLLPLQDPNNKVFNEGPVLSIGKVY
ncbi:MAG: SPASM domain-containing protein [Clostridiales bacterium]